MDGSWDDGVFDVAEKVWALHLKDWTCQLEVEAFAEMILWWNKRQQPVFLVPNDPHIQTC